MYGKQGYSIYACAKSTADGLLGVRFFMKLVPASGSQCAAAKSAAEEKEKAARERKEKADATRKEAEDKRRAAKDKAAAEKKAVEDAKQVCS